MKAHVKAAGYKSLGRRRPATGAAPSQLGCRVLMLQGPPDIGFIVIFPKNKHTMVLM